jgi:hypothetical protein
MIEKQVEIVGSLLALERKQLIHVTDLVSLDALSAYYGLGV